MGRASRRACADSEASLAQAMRYLLDTHVLVWWIAEPSRLRKSELRVLQRSASSPVLVSDVTLWEIAMLVERGRLVLGRPVREWLEEATAAPHVESARITPAVAAERRTPASSSAGRFSANASASATSPSATKIGIAIGRFASKGPMSTPTSFASRRSRPGRCRRRSSSSACCMRRGTRATTTFERASV